MWYAISGWPHYFYVVGGKKKPLKQPKKQQQEVNEVRVHNGLISSPVNAAHE